jgi:methylenetetrahydrofolate dehydrogenase (NADP+)/methenyltetrahydrofolate cyclohydrolase
MVKDGAVVIDVDYTCIDDSNQPKGYIITGDVDFENVSKKVSSLQCQEV